MMNSAYSFPAPTAKLAFMGSDAIGLPLLEFLHTLVSPTVLRGVISQPDRPVGRGQKLTPNPIAAYARAQGIPLLQPHKPDAALSDWLCAEAIDLVIVMAYGHLLKPALLAIPPQGFVNLHASILPRYRGASPIQSAIAAGETETGVSLMRIEPAMDSGAVCDIEKVAITPTDTGASVFAKIAAASVPLTARHLASLLDGTAQFIPQDASQASYTRKLTKEDGFLDFNTPAHVLRNQIQAYDPWPSSFFQHQEQRLKVRQAWVIQGEDSSSCPPGTFLGIREGGFAVATGKGILGIREVQRPGGKMLPAADFLRGYPLESGILLG